MLAKFLKLSLLMLPTAGWAQFQPAAGESGTSAIYKDSSIFVNWAKTCVVDRGLQQTGNDSLGYVTAGESINATGMADLSGIVSLGDGGMAVLTFEHPIKNGEAYDFAIFENGFKIPGDSLYFLELAFVEVSSDGENFFRFKSTSHSDTSMQVWNGQGIDPRLINNLAGKYTAGYGTPFDLEELSGIEGLDINKITHVRITDVVGSIQNQFASRDYFGNIINDPWPTAFFSGGFDLDAVGVINQAFNASVKENEAESSLKVYPVPLSENNDLIIELKSENYFNVDVRDALGSLLLTYSNQYKKLRIENFNFTRGIYFVNVSSDTKFFTRKIIVK